jgi:beta-barrel assembly-enhancing protease
LFNKLPKISAFMDKSYQIQYLDGNSSRTQEATLWLRENAWEIQTNGSYYDPPQTIRWEMDKIHRNETPSSVNTFRYGDFPYQTLECRDVDFPKTIMAVYPEYKLFNKGYLWVFSQGIGGVVTFAAILLGLMVAIYFWVLPGVAESLADKMPRKYEIQLGNSLSESMLKGMDIDEDRTLALQDFSSYIDFQTDYPLQFTVVKSDVVNAFALPGGKIVVFDELLDKIDSPEALTALLAHEATHVKKRHSLKGMARSLSGYLFVSILFGDLSGLTSVLVENANSLGTLGYTRSLEHEADVEALATLTYNKLDQKGMVDLMETLDDASHDSEFDLKKFQFLSSHPLTQDRIIFAKETAAKQGDFEKKEGLELAFAALKKKD